MTPIVQQTHPARPAHPVVRRAALAVTALALAAGGLLGPAALAAPAVVRQAPPTSTVTFKVPGCEGCKLRAYQVLEGRSGVWQSRSVTVIDKRAVLVVPTAKTAGLSVSIRTPWEGTTGYVTEIAFRYGQQRAGDKVGFNAARTKQKASGCWAGTTKDEVTIPVKVRRVSVDGVDGPTAGTLAWAGTTQRYLRPMTPTVDGVLGSQEVLVCDEP